MKEFLHNLAITVGFLGGNFLGGFLGSLLGGIGVFFAYTFVAEKLESKRKINGFWLRYRGATLCFILSITGVVVCSQFLEGFWGIGFGIWGGSFIGETIANKLGWGGESLQNNIEFRKTYLAVLASAACVDGSVSEKTKRLVVSIAKEMFFGLGFADDADMIPMVQTLLANPLNSVEAGVGASGWTPELASILQADLCKILFSNGEITPSKEAWLDQFQSIAQLPNWGALCFYTQTPVGDPGQRNQALGELGLKRDASKDEILKAYRELARIYHPDKQDAVAPHLRELAANKMAAINCAYELLTKQHTNDSVYFQDLGGRPFSPPEGADFECRCWLCKQVLRVPSFAESKSARCSKCFALAGLGFVPTFNNTPKVPPERFTSEPKARFFWIPLVVFTFIVLIYFYQIWGNDFKKWVSDLINNRDGDSLGQCLSLGAAKIYFTEGIKQDEAQKLGDLLWREKLIGAKPSTVQVRLKNQRYEVRVILSPGLETDLKTREWYKEISNIISRECFNGSPVDIHFCNDKMKTLSVVSFEPLSPIVKGLTARWDSGIFSHDFIVFNESGFSLENVILDVVFYRDDGTLDKKKIISAKWGMKQPIKVNIPAINFQKEVVTGTAFDGQKNVRINREWNITP